MWESVSVSSMALGDAVPIIVTVPFVILASFLWMAYLTLDYLRKVNKLLEELVSSGTGVNMKLERLDTRLEELVGNIEQYPASQYRVSPHVDKFLPVSSSGSCKKQVAGSDCFKRVHSSSSMSTMSRSKSTEKEADKLVDRMCIPAQGRDSPESAMSFMEEEIGMPVTPVTPDQALTLLNSLEDNLSQTKSSLNLQPSASRGYSSNSVLASLAEETRVATVEERAQANWKGRSLSHIASLFEPSPDLLDAGVLSSEPSRLSSELRQSTSTSSLAWAKNFMRSQSLSKAKSKATAAKLQRSYSGEATAKSASFKSEATAAKLQRSYSGEAEAKLASFLTSGLMRRRLSGAGLKHANGERRAGGSAASSSKKRSYSSGAAFYASQVQRQSFESSQSPSSRTATASVLSNHKQTNNAHSTLRHRSSIADEASPGTLDRSHSQQLFHPSVIQINRSSSFTY